MGNTEISSWGHSAIRLERDDQRLVFDPGVLSDLQVLDSADAVLITHEHGDHWVAEPLVAAMNTNAELQVWAPESVVPQLLEAGAPADRVHEAKVGGEFTAAGFEVKVIGGKHAVIYPEWAPIVNVAYLVEGALLHPGDSFTPPPSGTSVEVLFAPISAPWLKAAEAIDYLKSVQPATAIPIHDGILSDGGKGITDGLIKGLIGDIDYHRLSDGETLTYSK